MPKQPEVNLIATVYTQDGVYRPGEPIPEKVARGLDAHCFEDGVHPYPAKKGRSAKSDGGSGDEQPEIPPMGGAGSGVDAWRAYAEALEVDLPEDAKTRDDVVKAIEAAGHPVEAPQE